MTRRLLVASTGGHLEQIHRLESRLQPAADHVAYATFDDQQSRSLLLGRDVHTVRRIPPRGLGEAFTVLASAYRILRAGRYDSVVSTGSAIAVPFFLAGRALGMQCHYIESAARSQGPSLTGRILARLPGVRLYSQYPQWADETWTYIGSGFDGYEVAEERSEPPTVKRVVVTLGTMRGFPFRRAVDATYRLLREFAPDAEVMWQVGDTPVDDLPIEALDLVASADLRRAVQEADLVIAHAGVGSSLMFLEAGLCPVLLPRSARHGEHIDDHQWMIADVLASRGLAVSRDPDDLTVDDLRTAAGRHIRRSTPAPYQLDEAPTQGTPSPRRRIRVAVVGSEAASQTSRGGIASVISLMTADQDDDTRLRSVTTYRDTDRGDQARVFVSGLARLARMAMTGCVDVAHVHVSYKGSVFRKAIVLHMARLLGIPTVLHAHSHGFKAWFDGTGPVVRRLARTGLRADRWIVLGDALAEEYRQMFDLRPEQITVLRNPVELRPAPRVLKDQSPARVVFLGRLGDRKGAFDLVEALSLLPEATRSRLQVVMAGDGDVEGVRRRAEALGVSEIVELPGWIGPQERADLLEQASAFVLPSYEEGLPMAMLEAMSFGVPVVVTPVGGIGEVVQDGVDGLLVTPGRPGEIAAALQRVIDDPTEGERLGRAAWEASRRFDVTLWRSALRDVWEDVRR